ncbi:methyltransferase domain-containing protein [Streptomyces laculatispora]|uniref:methyltransferase domain-containing protein n=1 Tax=Streptomyces laculatispora TaxID=887464 RepID=UPI001A94E435|nr:methyltransferase domain-containing protein [Streptomyces laculatispora]MBO0918531.1 methyltransferase domain-containing protein [Streptomyces laculatispora]
MTDPSTTTSAVLRARFAAMLGEERKSPWLAAFADVPREHYVPSFYRQDAQGQWQKVSEGDPGYLETVYSDTALTTQLDEHGIPTSSSSEPRLMLTMLDALDARPGHRLYELGLGTGYNAALASAHLGSDNVVSMDIDPDLVRLARRRLARGQHHPLVLNGDGAQGYPDRAPYDRIIATAGLHGIPPALLGQARQGTVVVAPIGFGIARVVVSGDGEATGRFLPVPAFFMPRRTPTKGPDFATLETQTGQPTTVPATDALDRLKFPLSLALPGYSSCTWQNETGEVTGVGLWTEDGSTATVHVSGKARQTGPRRLWDTVESLASAFPKDTPAREDFGLTITPEGQRAWYREPEGPSWSLPACK